MQYKYPELQTDTGNHSHKDSNVKLSDKNLGPQPWGAWELHELTKHDLCHPFTCILDRVGRRTEEGLSLSEQGFCPAENIWQQGAWPWSVWCWGRSPGPSHCAAAPIKDLNFRDRVWPGHLAAQEELSPEVVWPQSLKSTGMPGLNLCSLSQRLLLRHRTL